ncbi:response regulator [Ideonella sp.]|uniref:response regulator n=1 Tax=Ideonella sp. TaxID=1929293 RepID=UPI0035B16833
MEVWGRFAYLLGLLLMLAAYGGFALRPGGRWGLGRIQQTWDAKALLSVALTFVLILATGYLGSFIVLVPGAQTFESLKDLCVFLCIVLFGYPALLAVPLAYGLSDLIEGVPPNFLLNWLEGYFINPACFWVALQLIGKNPDFRRARTWGWYGAHVLLFMAIEPQLWGYICSEKFSAEISYRNITPALFFTTSITWLLAPWAMLAALPLARRFGLFWADIPGHARERRWRSTEPAWESGAAATGLDAAAAQGLPVRIVLVAPFIALVLAMVVTTAYLTLSNAQADATKLASRLHEEIAETINLKLDEHLERAQAGAGRGETVDELLWQLPIARSGRAFIIDRAGGLVASSLRSGERLPTGELPAAVREDLVVDQTLRTLRQAPGGLAALHASLPFRFDIVTAKPLSRETWLAHATPYQDRGGGHADWILLTAMPEAYYLSGVREGNVGTAKVLVVALILSLIVAVLLAELVTAPIRRISDATRALARGELNHRIAHSRLEELGVLAESFNDMAAQLNRHTERLQLATSAARMGIWDWNVVTDELVWDDEMYRLYGMRREDHAQGRVRWSAWVHPDDLKRAKADVIAALRGEREFVTEFRVIWPDGSVHVLSSFGRTVRDEQGKAQRMVGVNFDVTALKNAEQELIQHRDHLEKLVTERTEALTVALAAANSATQAKSEFLANMSHEIRTPMNAVIGMIDLALRGELHAKQRGYLAMAKTAAHSLLGIINDILDFSKIEAGKLNMEQQAFSLRDVFDSVMAIAGMRAQEKGLPLKLDVGAGVPDLLIGDSLRLEQVLLNLCSNAVKFTERGKILLRVERSDVHDAHQPLPADRVVLRFSVRDSGIGMSQAQVRRLFEPFNQADASTTRVYGGTGLGLAICRRLVELMGGEIVASSELGQGSEFVFTAQFGTAASDGAAPDAVPSAGELPTYAALKGRRILLVEDNDINQIVARELLEDVCAVSVEVASSGRDALAKIGAAPFDLVLMDVQMPEMDGYETTRRLRADPRWARLPIVAMTAHAMAKDRAMCQQAGMDDFVTKPFVPDELFRVLAKWMPDAPAGQGQAGAGDPVALRPAGVSIEAGLARCMGRADLYARVAERFVASAGDVVGALQQCLSAQDHEGAARTAHTLISSAGLVGALHLADLARELETALREDHPAVRGRLSPVEAELASVCAWLAAYLESRDPSAAAVRR